MNTHLNLNADSDVRPTRYGGARMKTSSRWNAWVGRARLCCKATTAIDDALSTAQQALVLTPEPDTAQVLREAQAALERARLAVQEALRARRLTAENREPVYGLAA